MLTIFNRKELCITFSLKEQGNIRDLLNANGIEYYFKVDNRSGHIRGHMGSFGINMDLEHKYIFYVNKKDFEKAKYIIRR